MIKRKVPNLYRKRRKSEQSPKCFCPLKHRTRLKKSVGSCAKNRTSEKAEKTCFCCEKLAKMTALFSSAKSRKTIVEKGQKTGATKRNFGRCFGSFHLHTKSHAIFGLPRLRASNHRAFRHLRCSYFLLF